MAGDEFSFFWDVYKKIDIKVDISTFLRSMVKFGKRVHLEELAHLRLIR